MGEIIHGKAAEKEPQTGLFQRIQDEGVANWVSREVQQLPGQASDWISDQVQNHWKRDGGIALAALAAYGGWRLAYLQRGVPWLGLTTEVPGLLRGGMSDYQRLGTAMERDLEIAPTWRRTALARMAAKGIAAPKFTLRWPSIPEE